MSINPSDIAWNILSEVQSVSLEELGTDYSPLEIAEISRITSLNIAIAPIIKRIQHLFSDNQIFTKLSPLGIQNQIESKPILDNACQLVKKVSEPQYLKNCTSRNLNEILSWIHSYGSHAISSRGLTSLSRRVTGSVYTPIHLADTITESTLGPKIESCIRDIRRNGVESLRKITNLRILDPACGPGTFLLSAIRVIHRRWDKILNTCTDCGLLECDLEDSYLLGSDATPAGYLYGIDLDSAALEIARVSLLYELATSYSEFSSRCLDLRKGNSLISLKGICGSKDLSSYFINRSLSDAFEWTDAYPDILPPEGSGFDIVLMNPPYNRLKSNFAEFVRNRLEQGQRNIVFSEFENHKEILNEEVTYFRKSGEYNLGNYYTIDTYRLFIERALQVASENARIGFVVPSSLLGDISASKIRTHLLTSNRILSINEFSESARLFPHITQSVCIVIIERGGTSSSFDLRYSLDSIVSKKNPVTIHFDDITQTMGRSHVIPCVNENELRILKQIHANPEHHLNQQLENWRGEFDLTLDKRFLTKTDTSFPLIRGSDISRYQLRPDSNFRYVDLESFRLSKHNSNRIAHINEKRLACQQISNRNQRWRLKFTRIQPRMVLANSCNYMIEREASDDSLDFILGVLNSELMNWRFHLGNSNNHVSNRELSLMPVLNPSKINPDNQNLVKEVSLLVQSISKGSTEVSPLIDARVFYLYNVDIDGIFEILQSRGTPKPDQELILEEMNNLQ